MQTEIRVPQEAWRDFQNLASLIRGFNVDGSGDEVVLTPLADAERDRLRGLLRELYSWAKNWGSAFMEDDEWPEVGERIDAALKGGDDE